jgi:hypothetical protein
MSFPEQDPDFQPIYRLWADAKWPELVPVEPVRFDIETRGPYTAK